MQYMDGQVPIRKLWTLDKCMRHSSDMLAMVKTLLCCTYSNSLFKCTIERCIHNMDPLDKTQYLIDLQIKKSYTNGMLLDINFFNLKPVTTM